MQKVTVEAADLEIVLRAAETWCSAHACRQDSPQPMAVERLRAALQQPAEGGELSDEQLLETFGRLGMRIELGAQFSARGQIAQLLNGCREIMQLHPPTPAAGPLAVDAFETMREAVESIPLCKSCFESNSCCRPKLRDAYKALARHRSAATTEASAAPVGEWQYYYRVNGCKAKESTDESCICWHSEGSGPYNNETHDNCDFLEWRPTAKAATTQQSLQVAEQLAPFVPPLSEWPKSWLWHHFRNDGVGFYSRNAPTDIKDGDFFGYGYRHFSGKELPEHLRHLWRESLTERPRG